jgi:hypothetical protein
MPRAHIQKNTAAFDAAVESLRSDIQFQFGRPIRSIRDCRQLSEEISFFNPSHPLAISTLRRFFGLIDSPSAYSITTLDALARFARRRAFDYYLQLVDPGLMSDRACKWDYDWTPSTRKLPDPSHNLYEALKTLETVSFAPVSGGRFLGLAQTALQAYAETHAEAALWDFVLRHRRARRMIAEYVPPMDYLGGWGGDFFQRYAATAESEEEKQYGLCLVAMGAMLREQWDASARILQTLPDHFQSQYHAGYQGLLLGMKFFEAVKWQQPTDGIRQQLSHGLETRRAAGCEYHPDWGPLFVENCAWWLILCDDHKLMRQAHQQVVKLLEDPEIRVACARLLPRLIKVKGWLETCLNGSLADHPMEACAPYQEKTHEMIRECLRARTCTGKTREASQKRLEELVQHTGYSLFRRPLTQVQA